MPLAPINIDVSANICHLAARPGVVIAETIFEVGTYQTQDRFGSSRQYSIDTTRIMCATIDPWTSGP